MAENHFSRAEKGSQSVLMGVLGGVFVLKSGLRILIRAPEVAFLVPPEWLKLGHFSQFSHFGAAKNGTSGARIKILRPLL